MEIKIKSLKFDADQKLIAFVEKKVARVEKFFDGASEAEVTLSLGQGPDNKGAKLVVYAPGQKFIIEREASSFENAVSDAVDAMKEKMTRAKEKREEA